MDTTVALFSDYIKDDPQFSCLNSGYIQVFHPLVNLIDKAGPGYIGAKPVITRMMDFESIKSLVDDHGDNVLYIYTIDGPYEHPSSRISSYLFRYLLVPSSLLC